MSNFTWHLLSGQSPETGHWMVPGNFYSFGNFYGHYFYISGFCFRAAADDLGWNTGPFLLHTGEFSGAAPGE